MKTLDQIVTTGTTAEKQLAQLAQQYPTQPEELISDAISQSRKSYFKWMAGGIIGMPLLGFLGFGEYGVPLISLTSIIASLRMIKTGEYKSAKKSLEHLEEWQTKYFTEDNSLFYYTTGNFTCSPTPVDILFGQRIYPINSIEEWTAPQMEQQELEKKSVVRKSLPDDALVFLNQVYITEKKRVKSNYSDFVPGAGSASIDYTQLTLAIEKNGQSVEYTTSVRDSLIKNTTDFFQLDTGKQISLICQMKDKNTIGKIIESYHYLHENIYCNMNLEEESIQEVKR